MRLIKHSFSLLILQFLSLAASFGISILISRVLGPAGKGAYALVVLLASLLTLVTSLGLNIAATYFVGRGEDPLEDVVEMLLGTAVLLGVLASALAGIAFLLFRGSYFREIAPLQIAFLMLQLPLAQICSTLGAAIAGRNRTDLVAGINFSMLGSTVLLQLGLAAFGRLTVTSALFAWMLGTLIGMALTLWNLGRLCRLRISFRKLFLLRKMLGYGVKVYIANLTTFFNYRLDTLIINGFLNAASVGFYSVAVSLAEAIWLLANSISTVLFPYFSSASREEADRLAPLVCRITIFVTAIGSLFVLLIGKPLIALAFSPQMLPAFQPLLLLLPGIISLSGGKITASYLSGIGKPIYATYISSINLVLIVILDLVMIPAWGISGAAIASSIAYTLVTILAVAVFLRETRAPLGSVVLIHRQDFALLGTAGRKLWLKFSGREETAGS